MILKYLGALSMAATPTLAVIPHTQQKQEPVDTKLNEKQFKLNQTLWNNGGNSIANFVAMKFISPEYFAPVHCDIDLPHTGMGVDKAIAWYTMRYNNTSGIRMHDYTITTSTPTEHSSDDKATNTVKIDGVMDLNVRMQWHGYTLNTATGDTVRFLDDGAIFDIQETVSFSLTYGEDTGNLVSFTIDWPKITPATNDRGHFSPQWDSDAPRIQLKGKWDEPEIANLQAMTQWDEYFKNEKDYMNDMLNLLNTQSLKAQYEHPYHHMINYTQKQSGDDKVGKLVEKRERVIDLNELITGIMRKAHNDSYKIDFHFVEQTVWGDKLISTKYTTPVTGLKVIPYADDNFVDLTMSKTDWYNTQNYDITGAEVRWLPDKPSDPEPNNGNFFDNIINNFKDDPIGSTADLLSILTMIL